MDKVSGNFMFFFIEKCSNGENCRTNKIVYRTSEGAGKEAEAYFNEYMGGDMADYDLILVQTIARAKFIGIQWETMK